MTLVTKSPLNHGVITSLPDPRDIPHIVYVVTHADLYLQSSGSGKKVIKYAPSPVEPDRPARHRSDTRFSFLTRPSRVRASRGGDKRSLSRSRQTGSAAQNRKLASVIHGSALLPPNHDFYATVKKQNAAKVLWASNEGDYII